MFELDVNDEHYNFKLYQCPFIVNNQKEIIEETELALSRFDFVFKNTDSTKLFSYYNFFQLTTGLSNYHKIFKSLISVIREYVGENKPLWLQCWVNRHTPNAVLKRHNHLDTSCFGYVSIDPKESETIFDDYVIENQIGQLYIGPNATFHEVKVLKYFSGYRITLGFDVMDEKSYSNLVENKLKNNIDVNIGYWPI